MHEVRAGAGTAVSRLDHSAGGADELAAAAAAQRWSTVHPEVDVPSIENPVKRPLF